MTNMSSRKQWTQDLEQNLIELWQEHECLYDVGHEMYHNRSEKEKRWTEITDALKQPGEQNVIFTLSKCYRLKCKLNMFTVILFIVIYIIV